MTDAALPPRPPITFRTKALYGLGAAANIIKQRGITTFLLLFYNQVVGLPPAMVSTAIMIALIFDAFIDPMIGQISDNTRSRWGRRHPFMYAAALPVSIAFYLIWNPPVGWENEALFAYMLVCLLTIRLFDTFFELPSSALLAELTSDYNQRTSMIAIRSFCGVAGGLIMQLMVYQVFLKKHADGSGGLLERNGWQTYSIVAAITIFTIILISAAGTHHQIPYLRKPPTRKITVPTMLREVGATLNNRSFVALTVSGMFMNVSLGLKTALELYFNLYFWGLNQGQLAFLTVTGVVASVIGVVAAPKIAARLGKRLAAITMFFGAVVALLLPIGLRILGLMPENGTPLLFGILVVDFMANGAMAMMTGVMLQSMIADVVEDAEVKTGRRSEGLLFSADNLFKKIVSGVGVFVSGVLLAHVAFPQGAKPGQVDPELLRNLALIYLPTIGGFYAVAITCLFLYRIDKTQHEENLRKLQEGVLEARTTDAQIETGAPAASGPAGDLSPVAPKA
ncbi:MFS transporter [Phenylobacterium sp.]|jgi:Na+/melibiose symporter-like transporter|uniref:MFS transporter n=1 Tax=Phenylobacterium sp. TaxID=1871053 RepID=UPI0035B2607E